MRKESHVIEHTLDTTNSILYVRPKSALEQADFEQLAKAVDPFIEKQAISLALSSRRRRFRDGKVLARWRRIFALCVIITSA
mgnify:CR=1 FL=1